MSTGQHSIRSDGFLYPIVYDHGVYPFGEGYERMILIRDWNPNNLDQLARISIRVDRMPQDSYARIEPWTPASGWQTMIQFSPEEFWSKMPSFQRWSQDRAETATFQVASDLIGELVGVASDANV